MSEAPSGRSADPSPLAVPERRTKPWGTEIWFAQTDAYLGKILEVEAGRRLSLQRHHHKQETLMLLEGEGILELDGRTYRWLPGRAVQIDPGQVHRFTAVTRMVLLEVSTNFPDDVERLEDDYGRA